MAQNQRHGIRLEMKPTIKIICLPFVSCTECTTSRKDAPPCNEGIEYLVITEPININKEHEPEDDDIYFT